MANSEANKLLFDLIPEYTKNLHNVKGFLDLQAPTRSFLSKVREVVYPNFVLMFKPMAKDPQSASKEESWGDADFVEEVGKACQEFVHGQQVFQD